VFLGPYSASLCPSNVLLAVFCQALDRAEASGKVGPALQAIDDAWMQSAQLKTYGEAVADALRASNMPEGEKSRKLERWLSQADKLPNQEARVLAAELGVEVFWDWDLPRTREGFYRFQGSTKACIARGIGKSVCPSAVCSAFRPSQPVVRGEAPLCMSVPVRSCACDSV
jgi:hypothetical protein